MLDNLGYRAIAIILTLQEKIKKMKLFANVDTNQYWLTLWSMIITGILVLATIVAVSAHTEDVMVTQLIVDGHDPIELACLYARSESIESACLIIAQAKAKVLEDAIK